MRWKPFILLLAAALFVLARPAPADDGIEFFERHVRPVLAEQCYGCHSAGAEKLKAGLYLDSRDALLKGGDSGPSIIPGDPEQSLLVKAIRHADEDLQMPPKKKLPAEAIAHIESWVRMGAPYPASAARAAAGPSHLDIAEMRRFWSFQPPVAHPPPQVRNTVWPRNPIDHFVLAALEENGLAPSPPADKRTLIRRATLDLIGLPPTPEEVAAFEADDAPDAFARVVDRLLASPHYGERWGRYWLDIARYADSKGYVFQEERKYPYAYTYRDWVVRAFNEDLPHDEFLIQQIAADQLDLGDDRRPLAAMGFLTLGRRFLNNIHDITDDRIDVVMRGTLGLTVTCARCHDHKYDPIPIEDYYSLYGIFVSSREPGDLPLLGEKARNEHSEGFEKELETLEQQLSRFLERKHKELTTSLRSAAELENHLLGAHEANGKNDEQIRSIVQKRNLRRPSFDRWLGLLSNAREQHHPVFASWLALADLPEADFGPAAARLLKNWPVDDPDHPVNGLVIQTLSAAEPKSIQEAAHAYAALLSSMNGSEPLEDAAKEELRQLLYAPGSPTVFALAEVEQLFNREDRNQHREHRQKIDALQANHPGAPPRGMVLLDNETPREPVVFIRGNPGNPGKPVPRQFLAILSPEQREPFKRGSGRLELAQAIASRDNPLTARVMVNRIWLGHFGLGLVRTPSDFGTRGDSPTHPELLDYLAVRFMDEGWSIKKLHRLVMLSSTYQQSSRDNPAARQIDPDNRLIWRMNRRRLDLEAMRDSLLAVSGQIDLTVGGRAVDIAGRNPSRRRTLYGFIDRQNLPGIFRTFDFASPDTHSPQRYFTTVPQQGLFMLNNPLIIEQAKSLVRRPDVAEGSDQRKIDQLHLLLYGRPATAEEVSMGLSFLQAEAELFGSPIPAPVETWQYGYGEFDEAAGRLKSFTRLPHFTGSAYQGGRELPDSKLGWCVISASGGHAGNDLQHAVIRRWTAPRDGVISISGKLAHPQKEGDGIRARILARQDETLAVWTAHALEADTALSGLPIRTGETVDFIVDCRGGPAFDSFAWSIAIRMTSADGDLQAKAQWDAAAEFAGPVAPAQPPLTSWEKYAQVLLMSNEFIFID